MNKRMRKVENRWVAAMVVTLLWCMPMKAALTAGGEYYIWLNIYEKLLGSNEAGSGPALSAYGTKSDGYVFVAESTGESDYFYLKQKSSGKYLAASSSNEWSIVFEDNKSTSDNRFRWTMTGTDCYAYLTNKKNSSSYVGVDGAVFENGYASIYYNKRKSSFGQFSVIPVPVTGSSWDDARQAYVSSVYTNAQGVKEIDYCQLNNKTINRSDAVDIHITSNDNPMLGNSSVNLGSDRTWLIFDNILPSKVISSYLKYVTINGVAAQKDVNCRVAIYLNGAAVIPIPSVVMNCEGTAGSFTLTVGNHNNLKEEGQDNTMMSFTLRRGYMATVATGENGSGYSRVYVADHADQVVTLPKASTKRVTSVYVKKWQYVSKKGWGNTDGSWGSSHLRATWYWSWSADYWSETNYEYVPCRQHRYWPSVSKVNEHASSATLSINEPEHSEQHEKSDCDCSDAWKNCTFMPDYQASGARIGGPQPTDFSWMNTFFGHVNDMAYRCDFAVTHAYWDLGGRDETSYADWFCNEKCKSVWNNTGRPVWLTEMEVSASWNSNKITSYEQNRKYLQVLLQKIDECPWIERYAIYGKDMWQTYMFYDCDPSKGLTPAAQVYRDHRATFAYNSSYTKEPIWWQPEVKDPTVEYMVNPDEQTITFTIGNTNGDAAETIILEYKADGGSWQQIATFSDRNQMEGDITYTKPLDMEGGKFRVSTTTIYGGNATGEEVNGPVLADIEALYHAIKSHPIGFERGEYAPYNNVDGVKAIAEAEEINHYDSDLHAKSSAVCQKIANAVWTPNTVELDAVYDGTFAHAENNGAPAGWTMSNNTLGGATHSRAFVGESRLSEYNSTKSGFFMRFDGTYSNRGSLYFYGRTDGYTMPLKANADYRLTADAKGWNSVGKPLTMRVTGPTGFTALDNQIKTESKADTDDKAPQQLVIDFKTTVAGNYEFYFQTPGSDDNKHMVVVSNISLTRTSETVSVGESGYATYVSGRDLDFSATDIKAYMAAVEGGFVVLTPINKVKAGTPVILYYKGGNKEEAIPLATTTDAATGNQLKAGEGKAVASDGGNGVVNCILNKVGGQIGFYRANGQVVAWNRAYLPVSSSAARLDIRFADETTGAALVKSEEVKSEQLFDLKGQRVSSPKKGVYIQNGKKVVK